MTLRDTEPSPPLVQRRRLHNCKWLCKADTTPGGGLGSPEHEKSNRGFTLVTVSTEQLYKSFDPRYKVRAKNKII